MTKVSLSTEIQIEPIFLISTLSGRETFRFRLPIACLQEALEALRSNLKSPGSSKISTSLMPRKDYVWGILTHCLKSSKQTDNSRLLLDSKIL